MGSKIVLFISFIWIMASVIGAESELKQKQDNHPVVILQKTLKNKKYQDAIYLMKEGFVSPEDEYAAATTMHRVIGGEDVVAFRCVYPFVKDTKQVRELVVRRKSGMFDLGQDLSRLNAMLACIDNDKELPAIKIAALWRGKKARKEYAKLKGVRKEKWGDQRKDEAVSVIQCLWRKCLAKQRVRVKRQAELAQGVVEQILEEVPRSRPMDVKDIEK